MDYLDFEGILLQRMNDNGLLEMTKNPIKGKCLSVYPESFKTETVKRVSEYRKLNGCTVAKAWRSLKIDAPYWAVANWIKEANVR